MYNRKDCKKNQRQIIKLLREITSHTHYGIKTVDGPRQCNKNEMVQRHYNLLKLGRTSWLKKLKNANYKAHFASEVTHYYLGNQRMTGKCKYTLVMIDIDCHRGVGTHEGAVACAEYIKKNYFPNLYHETSTNGVGVHCYIIVDKHGLGPEFVNETVDHLEKVLKPLASMFDIQMIEVCGKAPDVKWDRNICIGVNAARLAKIPRGDFSGTDVVDAYVIRKMVPIETICDNITKSPIKVKSRGSDGARCFDDKELSQLDSGYAKVAARLMPETIAISGKQVATREDMSIFLMMLKFFTNNMPDNGAMPTARFRKMWKALYEADDITRFWQPKRFSAIRNHLTDNGLIDWQSHEYKAGKGEHKKGTACRWQASEDLMDLLYFEKEVSPSVVTNDFFTQIRPVEIITLADLERNNEYLIKEDSVLGLCNQVRA